jgi:hypothetical protein
MLSRATGLASSAAGRIARARRALALPLLRAIRFQARM